MADDPYSLLGISRDATAEQVRAAYRKLARKHHPDLNPNDKAAEERFKAITAAHALLSDPKQRARYDRGEITAEGHEVPPRQGTRRSYRDYAEGAQGSRYAGAGPASDEWMGATFEDLFGEALRGRDGKPIPLRGHDEAYRLKLDFLDAVNGATQRLTLPDGRTLDVKVPPGTQPGQVLRLRGRGGRGLNGGPDGDALIEIDVAPHPLFTRDGQTIRMELPVSLKEAVLGARIGVPTPGGDVTLTIPQHADSGQVLRLRGRGVPAHDGLPAGDLLVTLRVVVGPPDAALEAFLRDWTPPAHDPRKEFTRQP